MKANQKKSPLNPREAYTGTSFSTHPRILRALFDGLGPFGDGLRKKRHHLNGIVKVDANLCGA